MSAERPDVAEHEPTPCLIQIDGSLASGVLIPGVAYRVVEVREHWEPTGVVGEPPRVSTVIRFDPAHGALDEEGLNVERLGRAIVQTEYAVEQATSIDEEADIIAPAYRALGSQAAR